MLYEKRKIIILVIVFSVFISVLRVYNKKQEEKNRKEQKIEKKEQKEIVKSVDEWEKEIIDDKPVYVSVYDFK